MLASGSPASKTYFIDVTTCDVPFAGTDSNIRLKIDGTSSSIGWVLLDNPNKDDFEQSETDFFSVVDTLARSRMSASVGQGSNVTLLSF